MQAPKWNEPEAEPEVGRGSAPPLLKRTLQVLTEPEVEALLCRGKHGLESVFSRYARDPGRPRPYERGHWTDQAMDEFAGDIDLAAELSQPYLHRFFKDCVRHEIASACGADGQMSFSCFRLALVMIAQQIHGTPGCTPLMRVALLMLRLRAARGGDGLGAAARSVLGARSPKCLQARCTPLHRPRGRHA